MPVMKDEGAWASLGFEVLRQATFLQLQRTVCHPELRTSLRFDIDIDTRETEQTKDDDKQIPFSISHKRPTSRTTQLRLYILPHS